MRLLPRDVAARVGRETVQILRDGEYTNALGQRVDVGRTAIAAREGTVVYGPDVPVTLASLPRRLRDDLAVATGLHSHAIARHQSVPRDLAVHLSSSSADWPWYNGSLEGTRYSTLAQITPGSAANLERACTFDTGEQMSMQSGPVVVNGVLYLTTDTSTYAIDAATCRRIWHTAKSYPELGFLKNNHGVAHMVDDCSA